MTQRIGIISIQGAFMKHVEALKKCGAQVITNLVRTPEDLIHVDKVIIPGGESTTVGMLMQRTGLDHALIEHGKKGLPIWGTCMGMILLAKRIQNFPPKGFLSLLDITVERNAFGPQISSFEDKIYFEPLKRNVLGVFIRAPIIIQIGDKVEVLSTYQNKIVAVKSGNIFATAFHPELTEDYSIHQWFLNQ